MGRHLNIRYSPSLLAAAFHASKKYYRAILGNRGCGKSALNIMDLYYKAREQAPDPEGIRHTRFVVVRNTESQLQTTTLATFKNWFPEGISSKIIRSPYLRSYLKHPVDMEVDENGKQTGKVLTRMNSEFIFLPMDKPDDVRKVLSLEITGAFINECREVNKSLLDDLSAAVGRYPNIEGVPLTWNGINMDTNPPAEDHWFYTMWEEEYNTDMFFRERAEFFKFPRSLIKGPEDEWMANPEADYVRFQKKGIDYWLDLMTGKSQDWINVYVHGLYGQVQEGKMIYPEWEDEYYLIKEHAAPIPDRKIILSLDYGLTPACAFMQHLPGDRLYVFDEICTENMGIRQFANEILKPYVLNNYSDFYHQGLIESTGDPAGEARDQSTGQLLNKDVREAGFPLIALKGANRWEPCREAVRYFMHPKSKDDKRLMVSPKCVTIVKGFRTSYKLRRLQVTGEARFTDKPIKNFVSHIMNALEYGCFYIRSPQIHGVVAKRTKPKPTMSSFT